MLSIFVPAVFFVLLVFYCSISEKLLNQSALSLITLIVAFSDWSGLNSFLTAANVISTLLLWQAFPPWQRFFILLLRNILISTFSFHFMTQDVLPRNIRRSPITAGCHYCLQVAWQSSWILSTTADRKNIILKIDTVMLLRINTWLETACVASQTFCHNAVVFIAAGLLI